MTYSRVAVRKFALRYAQKTGVLSAYRLAGCKWLIQKVGSELSFMGVGDLGIHGSGIRLLSTERLCQW